MADYIPQLAKVDPNQFGMAIVTVDGKVYSVGDADAAFSIQSISKVFTLTLALGKVGDGLWKRVGREPSGTAFNSIVQLEHEHGMPRNPFINAGAIAVTDVILSGHRAARGARRDPALRALPGRRRLHHHRRGGRALRRQRPASAISRSPITCAPSAISIIRSSMRSASISTTARIADVCRQLAMAGLFLRSVRRAIR